MSFTARLIRSPRPFDPDRAQDVLVRFPDADAALANLIGGAAGCSPYLAGLMVREADWLTVAFDDPEGALAAVFAALREVPLETLPRVL